MHSIETKLAQKDQEKTDNNSKTEFSDHIIETVDLVVLEPCKHTFEKNSFKDWRKKHPNSNLEGNDPITNEQTVPCPKCGRNAVIPANLDQFFIVKIDDLKTTRYNKSLISTNQESNQTRNTYEKIFDQKNISKNINHKNVFCKKSACCTILFVITLIFIVIMKPDVDQRVALQYRNDQEIIFETHFTTKSIEKGIYDTKEEVLSWLGYHSDFLGTKLATC